MPALQVVLQVVTVTTIGADCTDQQPLPFVAAKVYEPAPVESNVKQAETPCCAAGQASQDPRLARTKYRRAEMRSESEQERMEDAYENARDACYAMKGADEDRCIADVRTKYPRR